MEPKSKLTDLSGVRLEAFTTEEERVEFWFTGSFVCVCFDRYSIVSSVESNKSGLAEFC